MSRRDRDRGARGDVGFVPHAGRSHLAHLLEVEGPWGRFAVSVSAWAADEYVTEWIPRRIRISKFVRLPADRRKP